MTRTWQAWQWCSPCSRFVATNDKVTLCSHYKKCEVTPSMFSNSCNTNNCTKVLEKVIINVWVSILCFFRGMRDPKDWYVLFFWCFNL
jgi:hypothetical protein